MSWKEMFLDQMVIGDARILLRGIPKEQIDLMITSPLYHQQRDYDELKEKLEVKKE